MALSWRTSPALSAVFRAVGLSTLGFISWRWFVSSDDSAWRTDSRVATVALAAVVGGMWWMRREAVAGGAASLRRARISEEDLITN